MRTTVTLDDDLYLTLQTQARQMGKSFKVLLNEVVRLGVQQTQSKTRRRAVKIQSYPLGLPEGLSYDNVAELLERLEAPP
jgi:hypothetical protein